VKQNNNAVSSDEELARRLQFQNDAAIAQVKQNNYFFSPVHSKQERVAFDGRLAQQKQSDYMFNRNEQIQKDEQLAHQYQNRSANSQIYQLRDKPLPMADPASFYESLQTLQDNRDINQLINDQKIAQQYQDKYSVPITNNLHQDYHHQMSIHNMHCHCNFTTLDHILEVHKTKCNCEVTFRVVN